MEEKDFKQILGQFRTEIVEEFRHQMGVQREEFQHSLDLVVEGQQMLAERMGRVEGRMEGVEQRLDQVDMKVVALGKKVDTISDDLTAHRRDTEAHRKGYRIREE